MSKNVFLFDAICYCFHTSHKGLSFNGFPSTASVGLTHVIKETRFSLYDLGGLPSVLPINSPDIIAHIKGLSHLSDSKVIRASLGGAI